MSTVLPRAPITSTSAPDRARTTSRRASEHRFYFFFAVLAAMIVLVGFSRTYFLKEVFHTPALSPLVHLHGIVFSSWVALFVVQTWLVSSHRTRLHMRLGIAGFLLACTMIVVGTMTAITSARLGHTRPGAPPPLQFLVVPLFDILVFSILIAAGFLMRRRPDYHKRILLVATASLMTAAFGRIVAVAQGHANVKLAVTLTSCLVVIAAVIDAVRNRRIHPAFAWAGALVLISGPVRFMLAGTNAWMSFARWLTS